MNVVAHPLPEDRPGRCSRWKLTWWLPPDGAGRRPRRAERFRGSKRAAETRWNAVAAEIAAAGRSYAPPSRQTVTEWTTKWLAGKTDLRGSTLDYYERHLRRHILPALGETSLADLTAAGIQAWLDGLRNTGTGTAAIAASRTTLRIALQEAVRLGLLPANPVDRVRAPRHTPRQRQALTTEQATALFARADRTRIGPLLHVAYWSGLRRGELLALRWADVEWDAKTIRVTQSIVKGRHGKSETTRTKTEAGARTVALPEPAFDALREPSVRRGAATGGRGDGRE